MAKGYYLRDVNFGELAKHDPAWAKISANGKAAKSIDFKDPAIVLYVLRIPTNMVDRD